MKDRMFLPRLLMLLLMVMLFAGCNETPSEETVKEWMGNYLAARNYSIVNLELGEIRAGSYNEAVYMAKKTYTVNIKTVTIEASRDSVIPIAMKKGQRVTYSNAVIKVREKDRQKNTWEISVVSGMPLL